MAHIRFNQTSLSLTTKENLATALVDIVDGMDVDDLVHCSGLTPDHAQKILDFVRYLTEPSYSTK